jgi:hypothetical protein
MLQFLPTGKTNQSLEEKNSKSTYRMLWKRQQLHDSFASNIMLNIRYVSTQADPRSLQGHGTLSRY